MEDIKLILCIAMFAVTCGALLLGFPVAFTLAGVAFIFALLSMFVFGIDMSFLSGFPQRIVAIEQNETLVAVPLFIFMGVMLERSKVAEELLDNMGKAFGPLRGGLAISVCVVGALLAASTGIVGATVVTMGLLSLPTMLRRGYGKSFTCGTIAASGTLGQIIPPSIVLVLLGDQLATAYQTAQFKLGNFSPDTVSVNDLFAGALFPGLVLVGMYILYIITVAILRPESAPAIPAEMDETPQVRVGSAKAIAGLTFLILLVAAGLIVLNRFEPTGLSDGLIVFTAMFVAMMLFGYRIDPGNMAAPAVGIAGYAAILVLVYAVEANITGNFLILYLFAFGAVLYGGFRNAWRDPFWGPVLKSLIPPLMLIIAVLGSILGGLASPTEAAAVGAVGAIMLAGYRLAPERGRPVLIGGIALIAVLILTAKFDLRMQRNFIPTIDWIAIIAAIVLSALLGWGVVVSILRTTTFQVQPGGAITYLPQLEKRHWEVLSLLGLLVVAFFAMMYDQLWLIGIIAAVAVIWALASQRRDKRKGVYARNTVLSDVVRQTLDITAMVFIILVGAGMFSLVFRGLGGDVIIEEFLTNLPGGALGAMLVVMLAMFLLGFFLDFIEIVFIVVPLVAPVLLQLEFAGEPMNPVWLGVMIAVNLQTSYLTPPFGFALFYLRGVAPAEITTIDIYKGVVPFVAIQLLSLVVLWFLPGLATWLPVAIFSQ